MAVVPLRVSAIYSVASPHLDIARHERTASLVAIDDRHALSLQLLGLDDVQVPVARILLNEHGVAIGGAGLERLWLHRLVAIAAVRMRLMRAGRSHDGCGDQQQRGTQVGGSFAEDGTTDGRFQFRARKHPPCKGLAGRSRGI